MSDDLVRELLGAVEHALGGEDVAALRRQTDLRGWTGVGFDADVRAATVAVLEALADAPPPVWPGLPDRLRRLAAEVEQIGGAS